MIRRKELGDRVGRPTHMLMRTLLLSAWLTIGSSAYAAYPPPPNEEEIAAVPCNQAGWPEKKYVVYFGSLGGGGKAMDPAVAHGLDRQGWTQYLDKQVQPLLDGDNPPARVLVHCVGPAWPRLRNGDVVRHNGTAVRWFSYDWPLTVAEGRLREDGSGRWPGMPAYLEDFSAAWRSVADGSRSGGVPIETYAYTGMIRTPWLEELRVEDPVAYRERIVDVAEFFLNAGFSGMYVDAAASPEFVENHLGLRTLQQINDLPNFFVGVESYPAAKHDASTGGMRYFMSHWLLKVFHPRWPEREKGLGWQSQLPHQGLIVWHNRWAGGAYGLTPDKARTIAAMGDDIGVSWARWNELAGDFPRQQPPVKIRRKTRRRTSR